MSRKVLGKRLFIGGIADYDRDMAGVTDPSQAAFERSLDLRSNPAEISILPRTVKEATTTGLIVDGDHVIFPPVSDTTTNLISNGDFETNTTGWTLEADFTRSSIFAQTGSFSIKQLSTTGYVGLLGAAIPVSTNSLYRLTWYAKVSVGAGNLPPIAQINGGDVYGITGGVLLPNLYYFMYDTGGEWVQHSITVNSGNNTSIFVRIFNNGGTVTAYYDNFVMNALNNDTTYLYDRSGAIYSRNSIAEYNKLNTISSSHGNGMAYYPEDGYLYYAGDKTLGRYGNLKGANPQFSNDFLRNLGGNANNTYSIAFDGSTQYGIKADNASLSITSDIAMEAYVKPSTLPTAGSAVFVMGKWDENAQRSYKMDIIAVSAVFGDGSSGALTISSNTTQTLTDSSAAGTAGLYALSATNASFAAGQEILIHQSRGAGAGTRQRTKIQSYTAGTITTEDQLNYSYNSTGDNKAQVIVLPQYSSITVDATFTWSAKAWDGTVGGLLVYLCNGSVNYNGTVNLSGNDGTNTNLVGAGPNYSDGGHGIGFWGGRHAQQSGGTVQADAGESSNGDRVLTSAANGAGGGGATATAVAYWPGGGAGHALAGTAGTASFGSGVVGAAGGVDTDSNDGSSMVFGAGGGGGATGANGNGGSGGAGGGIHYGYAASFTINPTTGLVDLSGGNGGAGGNNNGGGAGAGGYFFVATQTGSIGTDRISVAGGTATNYAGAASYGKIAVYYLTSLTGTTTPTAYTVQDTGLVSATTYQLRLSLSSTGANVETLTKAIDITTGQWLRLGVSWKASTKVASFYRAGANIGTATGALGAIFDSTADFSVAAHKDSGGTYIEFFGGSMDDLRLFNTVRTDTQINNNKDIQIPTTETGLTAYYRFNNAATDGTSNANDLTMTGSPVYSALDVPFLDSTTRKDIDQTSALTGQTFTTATAIDESADTKRRYFTPQKDPQKSLLINFGTKGTGNVTLTVHDAQNTVVASKTVATADLPSSGVYEFVFDTVWRPIRASQYHFHVTSTVADATIVTGTTNDLGTAQFTTYYQFLVEDTKYHPIERTGAILSIGNERYVATWNASVYNPHRLVFPSGHRTRCIGQWGEHAVYGTMLGNNFYDKQEAYLFFWDYRTDNYTYYVPLPEGAPNAMYGTQEVLYVIAGYKGDLLEYRGGRKATKIKRLPKAVDTDKVEVLRKAMTMYDTLLRIGGLSGDSTVIERGVFTWGSARETHPDSLTYDYPISTGNRASADIEIGLVLPVGNKLLITWRDGVNYGVDVVDPAAAPFATATYEDLIISDRGLWKQEDAAHVRADFAPLLTGESVTIKYKKDRATDWTSEVEDTVGATELVLDVNGNRWRELQIGVDLAGTTTSPKVREFSAEIDELMSEKNFN